MVELPANILRTLGNICEWKMADKHVSNSFSGHCPQLNKRWAGYRKVHSQVCKRIFKRIATLQIASYEDYRNYLENHKEEWPMLDKMTRITISRFFRDKMQWLELENNHVPELLQNKKPGEKFKVWSAGCASGEEPYSFAILWQHCFGNRSGSPRLEIIATDADEHMLQRAVDAEYTLGSLKEMRNEWQERSFLKNNERYKLHKKYRAMVNFKQQDIREQMPDGPFDIIFCKNLVAMYFDKQVGTRLLNAIVHRLGNGGLLLLGNHEPIDVDAISGLKQENKGLPIFRK